MEVSGMLNATVEEGCTQVINFDSAIYGLSSINKAACTFGSHFYVLIKQHDPMTTVWLIPKECCKSPDAFVVEFCNEVLDQELRHRVSVEMAGIRNLLLAQAFSKASLLNCEGMSCA